jgi:uncharacterized protein (DUF58 family)
MCAPRVPSPSNRESAIIPRAFATALTHDFCPWANRYVYWLKHPLVVLSLAALVALAIGLSVAHQGYVAFGGIVAVMLLGVIWPWIGILGVRASLRFERRRAREGDRVGTVLTVTNRMPWPAWGLVLDRGFVPVDQDEWESQADSSAAGVALALARVPAFSKCDFRWDFEPTCRGVYPLVEPLLTTAFPFGLWTRQKQVIVESLLLVWPRIVPLEALPLNHGGNWTLGALSDRRAGYEGDVIGARAFRPGDLLRHVHWAQSARQVQMIVCERQTSLTASVRIVIDGSHASHVGSGPSSSLEWTLRLAASVCQSLADHDASFMVDLAGALLAIEPGRKGQERLNDTLARFRPDPMRAEPLWPTSKANRRSRVGNSRSGRSELEIVITTDLAAHRWQCDCGSGRLLVVLMTNSGQSASANLQGRTLDAWIVLDSSGDVAAQLKNRWAKVCSDARYAAQ